VCNTCAATEADMGTRYRAAALAHLGRLDEASADVAQLLLVD
jgi:hypothetical protein